MGPGVDPRWRTTTEDAVAIWNGANTGLTFSMALSLSDATTLVINWLNEDGSFGSGLAKAELPNGKPGEYIWVNPRNDDHLNH